MEEPPISGIAFTKNEAKLTLLNADVPGVASRILGPIADANIEVDMIVQNVAPAGDYTDFTFTVAKGDYKATKKLLEETVIPDLGGGELRGDDNIAKVSLVGVGMRSHAGVASKMFRVLADENVNIRMVSTSEIKISVVIDEKHMELAVNALHKAFGLDKSDIESE